MVASLAVGCGTVRLALGNKHVSNGGKTLGNTTSRTRTVGIAAVVAVLVVLVFFGVLLGRGSSSPSAKPASTGRPSATQISTGVVATADSAKKVKANEAGQIPVLMYHRIIPKRVASIDRTPDQLRQELRKLARKGYVPITAKQFVTGDIDVPAGKFPIVLTFDDGHPSHFALDAKGQPRKDTVVGILMEVAHEYPDFKPVATFYVNQNPFGITDPAKQAEAVHWLISHGFEVANHTWDHPNLPGRSAKNVQEEIAKTERMLIKLGAGPSTTMALPFGAMPHPKRLAARGSWNGVSYHFAGVFLAGAQPSVSPYVKSFDPGAIQRIQSNGLQGDCKLWCSQHWLTWLDKHPEERFVSDGDPHRISVPRRERGNIRPELRDRLITY